MPTSLTSALDQTSRALRRLSDLSAGERQHRVWIGSLVLDVVIAARARDAALTFLLRRAGEALEELPRGGERTILARLLRAAEESMVDGSAGIAHSLPPAFLHYAGELERTNRLEEAAAMLTLARACEPACPEVALHAGRVARRLGERKRALELYDEVRLLDEGSGAMARLASVGTALLAPDPERELGRAIRRAVEADDPESAAVAHEARAEIRVENNRPRAALRDLRRALLRYLDRGEQTRVALVLASVALDARETDTALEALSFAAAEGNPVQREESRHLLYELARRRGDRVGMRRWCGSRRQSPERARSATAALQREDRSD